MASMFDAAIFDMDGTLLESMRYWRYTSLEYLLRHNLPVPDEVLTRMIDTSSRKLLTEVLTDMGVPFRIEDVIREIEGYMDRHYRDDIRPKPGAVAYVRSLSEGGARVCLASATYREIVEGSMARNGFGPYIDMVTDSLEFGLSKSSPEYFAALARRMGTVPERCVVFEDALYAIRGAKAAGCKVCAVEDYCARNAKEEILSLCDFYIRDYQAMPEALRIQSV